MTWPFLVGIVVGIAAARWLPPVRAGRARRPAEAEAPATGARDSIEIAQEGSGWAVSRNAAVVGLFETRQDALEEAERLAGELGLSVAVMDVHGGIEALEPEDGSLDSRRRGH